MNGKARRGGSHTPFDQDARLHGGAQRGPPGSTLGGLGTRAPDRLVIYAGRLGRTLAVARALVISRRAIDLEGVQDGVGMLCAQTLDLPLAEARLMLPVLRELLAQVDTLSAVLRSCHG